MNSGFQIGNRRIGPGQPGFLIAEVAQSHDGSLGLAHSFIDAAAEAGADAIKFQTHLADKESTPGEPFRVHFSYEDPTRYHYWKRLEFTPEQWQGLFDHAVARGLEFLSSPFSPEAVELLEHIGVRAWKVASGEVNNPLLLDLICKTGKPVLLSSGMSSWSELDDSVQRLRSRVQHLAVFQCTSKYPTPLREVGLNVLSGLRQRYQTPVGLSDHSGSMFPGLAALALGAEFLEVHVTFHPQMFGPDVPVSLTFDQLRFLADARDAFHQMNRHPVDKDQVAEALTEMRQLFNKSVSLRMPLPQGTVLTAAHLTTKKPGTGIPARQLDQCVGKRLRRDITPDALLSWQDLE